MPTARGAVVHVVFPILLCRRLAGRGLVTFARGIES
ncbi:hypothetical protein STAFG_7155 [Streptomyces afghaniensis 772]|uniref:Uncharacterized protein n=1 Tax=Streptomyces afghaniensis 772 TaxID=1283301 RepID=S4MJM9_9ACTN|nr:hypothetical protein STAFG_7155 [Streptomyces afghaniensis 772]